MQEENVTHVTPKKEWQDVFIDRFSETGNVAKACRAAKVSRMTVYRERRSSKQFCERWVQAEEEAVTVLEDSAVEQALSGNATMTIFLLKNRAPHKYQDKRNLEHSGSVEINFAGLSDEQLDELEKRYQE